MLNTAYKHGRASAGFSSSGVVVVQVGVAAAGSVEARTLPLSSAATQNAVDAQEMAKRRLDPPSTFFTVQIGAATPGSVLVMTSPPLPAATQSADDGQETPKNRPEPSRMPVAVQVAEDAAGFEEATTWPPASAPTQNAAEGHYHLHPILPATPSRRSSRHVRKLVAIRVLRRPGRRRRAGVGGGEHGAAHADCCAQRGRRA